jgi:hypothetical protein
MNNTNQSEQAMLERALDLPERISDVISACENSPKELGMATVSMMLQSVLSRYSDAKHHIACRQADFSK